MVKTIDLTVRERLLIGSFFPERGSKKDQRIVKEILRKVFISPEERGEIGFVQDKDGIRWDRTKAREINVELNDDEREFLKRQSGRLDDEEAYTQELLALAERIELL